MKYQPKHKGIRIALCYILILLLITGCNSTSNQKGYFLASYYYTHDNLAIMRLYKLDDYKIKESIYENIKRNNSLKCFEIPISENDINYIYIRQLKEIRAKNKSQDILCKVNFDIEDINKLSYSRSDFDNFGAFVIKCDYYILSIIDGKITFHQFEPIEDVTLK